MISLILTIGIGGAIGAITRYMCGVWLSATIPNKPYIATLIVNVLGSILIGLFYLLSDHFQIKDSLRLLFVVGFLGFTHNFLNF